MEMNKGNSRNPSTHAWKHLAFAGPCKPLKSPSRSRVRTAIQKFWLNPNNVWNTMLPKQFEQTKWGELDQRRIGHKYPILLTSESRLHGLQLSLRRGSIFFFTFKLIRVNCSFLKCMWTRAYNIVKSTKLVYKKFLIVLQNLPPKYQLHRIMAIGQTRLAATRTFSFSFQSHVLKLWPQSFSSHYY